MLDGILRLGSILDLFRFVLVVISDWFRVGGLSLMVGFAFFRVKGFFRAAWFKIYI